MHRRGQWLRDSLITNCILDGKPTHSPCHSMGQDFVPSSVLGRAAIGDSSAVEPELSPPPSPGEPEDDRHHW